MKNKKAFAPIMTLVIILAVGLVAALGYIFYQNMNNTSSSNNTSNNTQTNNTNTANNSTNTSNNSQNNTTDQYKGYLVLDDWGVKFKIPTGLNNTNINYTKKTDTFYLTTARVEALGGLCSDGNHPLVIIYKYSAKQDFSNNVSAPNYINQVGDNYYYYAGTQSSCGGEGANVNLAADDGKLLIELVKNIEKK